MKTDTVTVSRTITQGGISITESATASLADDLVLDDFTESSRRACLAHALFDALPQLNPPHPPKCPPPLNSQN